MKRTNDGTRAITVDKGESYIAKLCENNKYDEVIGYLATFFLKQFTSLHGVQFTAGKLISQFGTLVSAKRCVVSLPGYFK